MGMLQQGAVQCSSAVPAAPTARWHRLAEEAAGRDANWGETWKFLCNS